MPSVWTVLWFIITVEGRDPDGSVQDHLFLVSDSVMFEFGCAVLNLELGFLVEWDKQNAKLNADVPWPCPTFASRFVDHALMLWCVLPPPRSGLSAQDLCLSTLSSPRQPPHWPLCSVRIWTQIPLLCGPETQAGPFVQHDKRKKGGHGRRINLSLAQTTHLLAVLISCLSLLWFLLLCFLLSLVRAEDIGSGCTANSQSRDTSLSPLLFFFLVLWLRWDKIAIISVSFCTKAAAF